MTQILCVCQNLQCIVCFSFIFSIFFFHHCAVCAHVLRVCRAEELSCMVHSGFTLAPALSLWQQIPHTLRCQLSTAFHTTCNICSLLTRVTTVSKSAWATKYHISLCCREIYRKFRIHIVFRISMGLRENPHFTACVAVKFGSGLLTVVVPPSVIRLE